MVTQIIQNFISNPNVTGLLSEVAISTGYTISTIAQTALGAGAIALVGAGVYLYGDYFEKARTESQVLQDLGLMDQEMDESKQHIVDWCKEICSGKQYNNRIIAAKRILKCYASGETGLDLRGLSLTTLPPLSLPSLERLYLQNNQIRELPASLSLPSLEELHLENNQLRELPASLSLPSLRWLDLKNNQIRELPASLSLPSLKWLHLQNNQLRELPASLSLPSLQGLHLENNQIRELPASLSLPSLRGLYLQNNQIRELPASLSLPSLWRLYLKNNQLRELPASLSLPSLKWLFLENNQQLVQLPLSLANSSQLTEIHIDGTQIEHSQVNQILTACRNLRDAEALAALPHLLQLWSGYAENNVDGLQFICNFSEEERKDIHEWLVRLSRTRDFRGNQRELAKIVYAMLSDLTNETFKELFITQIRANNEACQDRSAMAFNELYLSWKILVPKEGMTEQDMLALSAGAGKTLALRKVLSNMPQMAEQQEGVEIYLYYETHLRERLGLLTAIQTMAYEEVGRRGWVDEEELVQQVEKDYLQEVISLPIFDQLFSKDIAAQEEYQKILEPFGERLELLGELSEQEKITESEYLSGCDQCAREQQQASNEFKQAWLLSKLL